jgi:pimeloyl-[acyl-carrier protein] methyl ester esterase
VWDSVLPRLNRSFTTVCVDLPGHGASPWPPEFHDIDSLAARVEDCLEDNIASSARGCYLLGWSLGGMVALALAAKRPDLMRRLILVATTPKFLHSPDWPPGMDPKALADMAARVVTDFHATVRDFLMWQVHGDEHARPALKELRAKVTAGGEPNPQALRAGLETLSAVDLRSRLPDIDIPALVISGERDRLSHPDAGRALAAGLRHGRFSLLERAAHAPFLSHGAAFCKQIEHFLAEPA